MDSMLLFYIDPNKNVQYIFDREFAFSFYILFIYYLMDSDDEYSESRSDDLDYEELDYDEPHTSSNSTLIIIFGIVIVIVIVIIIIVIVSTQSDSKSGSGTGTGSGTGSGSGSGTGSGSGSGTGSGTGSGSGSGTGNSGVEAELSAKEKQNQYYSQAWTNNPDEYVLANAYYFLYKGYDHNISRWAAFKYQSYAAHDMGYSTLVSDLESKTREVITATGKANSPDFFQLTKLYADAVGEWAVPYTIMMSIVSGAEVSSQFDWTPLSWDEFGPKPIGTEYIDPETGEVKQYAFIDDTPYVESSHGEVDASPTKWDSVFNRKIGETAHDWMVRIFYAITGGPVSWLSWIPDQEFGSDWQQAVGYKTRMDPTIVTKMEQYALKFCSGFRNYSDRMLIAGLFDCKTGKMIGLPAEATTPSPESDPYAGIPDKWKSVALGKMYDSNTSWLMAILNSFIFWSGHYKSTDMPNEILKQFFTKGTSPIWYGWSINSTWNSKLNGLPRLVLNKGTADQIGAIVINAYKGKNLSTCGPSGITNSACLAKFPCSNYPTNCAYSCAGLTSDACYSGSTLYCVSTDCPDPSLGTGNCQMPFVDRSCNWAAQWEDIKSMSTGRFDINTGAALGTWIDQSNLPSTICTNNLVCDNSMLNEAARFFREESPYGANYNMTPISISPGNVANSCGVKYSYAHKIDASNTGTDTKNFLYQRNPTTCVWRAYGW